MALIKCPECGKEVSDKAIMCVNCGYPIREMMEKEITHESPVEQDPVHGQTANTEAGNTSDDWYEDTAHYDVWLMNADLEFDPALSNEDRHRIKQEEKRLLKDLLGFQDLELTSIIQNMRVVIAKDLDGGQVCKIAEAFLGSKIPFAVFNHATLSHADLKRIRECSSIPEALINGKDKPSAQLHSEHNVGPKPSLQFPEPQAGSSFITESTPTKKNVPMCPTCGSTDIKKIGAIDRAVSTTAWGLASKKINKTFKCNNCGYTW